MSEPPPPSPSPHWGPTPPGAFRRPSRWPTFIAIAIGLIGVAVGFVGWFRPIPHDNQPPPKPAYTAQQTADAKAQVCTAFEKVQHAVDLANTHAGSTDYTTQLAAAALTHETLDAGSRYLLTKLAEEPATPLGLASAVRNGASADQEALIGYMNGLPASDSAMQPALNASDGATATVRRLCK